MHLFHDRQNRRSFLKQSSLIAGALALPGLRRQRSKSLGIALVGLGYYSTDLLAPALMQTNHCHLAGIVTGSPEKIPVWQQKYGIKSGNVYDYDNMTEMANNDEIDVIYIVLPTGLHAKYAVLAANTGKHVWCEKPMARTISECEAIIKACADNKVKLSIGYRVQHEPNTQTIIEWSGTKPYGKITQINAQAGYRESRADHWKMKKDMGGGAMYDMGVYPLNALRYASGMEPVAVEAVQSTTRPDLFQEVDEIMEFTLHFANGTRGYGKTSFAEGMNELKITCENGWYELRPFQAYNGVTGTTSDGRMLNKSIPNQQARQMDDDALAIINDTPVMVPGEEGLADIRIVEAIYSAAKSGKIIELPR